MNKPDITNRFHPWKPIFRIHTGLTIEPAYQLAFPDKYSPVLDFDVFLPKYNCNLQRDFVWTPQQKSELIFSILENRHIPNLSIIQYRPSVKHKGVTYDRIWKIIDGKQRLSSVIEFLQNEFPVIVDGYEYFFCELPENLQHKVSYFEFIADIAYEYDYAPIPDEEKVKWFIHINYAGTPQDKAHLESFLRQ